MNEKKPTYRVEIKNTGTPPNETYGWKIYRNSDALPILRSQQLFVSRMAGLADANQSRLQLVDTDSQNWETKEQRFYRDSGVCGPNTVFCADRINKSVPTIKLRHYLFVRIHNTLRTTPAMAAN